MRGTISQFARVSQRSSVYLCKYTSNWGDTFASVCLSVYARRRCDGVSHDFQLNPNYGNFLFAQNDHVGTLSFEDENVGMLLC